MRTFPYASVRSDTLMGTQKDLEDLRCREWFGVIRRIRLRMIVQGLEGTRNCLSETVESNSTQG